MPLTGKQRHHLRALAHHLHPVVQVGHDGVSEGVLAQVDAALAAHELIKVRVNAECPSSRDEAAEAIAAGAHAEIAQTIGRIVVVFRRRPKKAKVPLSAGKSAVNKSQQGSKGRRPVARGNAKAKAKTAVARAAKQRKRDARRAPRRSVV